MSFDLGRVARKLGLLVAHMEIQDMNEIHRELNSCIYAQLRLQDPVEKEWICACQCSELSTINARSSMCEGRRSHES